MAAAVSPTTRTTRRRRRLPFGVAVSLVILALFVISAVFGPLLPLPDPYRQSLIESLEGNRGMPRLKPPYFPAAKGLYMMPTVVNNVETLANLPWIVANGGGAFADLGAENSRGTRLFAVSGHVRNPGVFEVEFGVTTFRDIIFGERYADGILNGNQLKAYIPGGASAPWFFEEHLDLPLEAGAVGAAGSMLGSGAIVVMDETTDAVKAAWRVVRFFARESCGKCTPCREGTSWLEKILRRILDGYGRPADIDKLLDVCDNISPAIAWPPKQTTICPLGPSAVSPIASALERFRSENRFIGFETDERPGAAAEENVAGSGGAGHGVVGAGGVVAGDEDELDGFEIGDSGHGAEDLRGEGGFEKPGGRDLEEIEGFGGDFRGADVDELAGAEDGDFVLPDAGEEVVEVIWEEEAAGGEVADGGLVVHDEHVQRAHVVDRRTRCGGRFRGIDSFTCEREEHAECGAASLDAVDGDTAPVLAHDAVHEAQAEAGAFAGRFRREERVEDMLEHLLRDAAAVVDDFERDARTGGRTVDGQQLVLPVARVERMGRIHDQVQHDLFDLARYATAGRQLRLEVQPYLDIACLQRIASNAQHVADDVVYVDGLKSPCLYVLALACDEAQVRHDLGDACSLAAQCLERVTVLGGAMLAQHQLDESRNGGERVVQLVRDTRHRLAERGQLLAAGTHHEVQVVAAGHRVSPAEAVCLR